MIVELKLTFTLHQKTHYFIQMTKIWSLLEDMIFRPDDEKMEC